MGAWQGPVTRGGRAWVQLSRRGAEETGSSLAESIQSGFVEPLDVGDDAQIDDFFAKAEARWGRLDFIVHSIAFANRESLTGNFRNTSRADFHLALDISAYSFIACARRAARLMGPGGPW